MKSVRVKVHIHDPLLKLGIEEWLRASVAVEAVESDVVDVVLVVAHVVNNSNLASLGRSSSGPRDAGTPRILVVADSFESLDALTVVWSGVAGVLPLSQISAKLLNLAIMQIAAGRALLPRKLQGSLLREIQNLTHGHSPLRAILGELDGVELDVVRLVAEGFTNVEIAFKLGCSSRSISHVLDRLMARLSLKNRTHAVAYALRNTKMADDLAQFKGTRTTCAAVDVPRARTSDDHDKVFYREAV